MLCAPAKNPRRSPIREWHSIKRSHLHRNRLQRQGRSWHLGGRRKSGPTGKASKAREGPRKDKELSTAQAQECRRDNSNRFPEPKQGRNVQDVCTWNGKTTAIRPGGSCSSSSPENSRTRDSTPPSSLTQRIKDPGERLSGRGNLSVASSW